MKRAGMAAALVGAAMAGVLGLMGLGPRAAAQTPVGPIPSGTAPLTAEDAKAWLDGYMPYALKRGGVAGAVVVIVKDGKVLFENGYGYSDVKTGAGVDPKTTMFRPGSVSKLFTWTAVMQLVEAGKIDLDADINTYLDFKIPARDGKPITMRNLMTHTTGFEEAVQGLIANDPKTMPTLEAALKHWTPHRVYDAGGTPAYSNYGAALAGYVVQRVSGQSFDSYIEDHIFTPLGMAHSTFRQPLPGKFLLDMSKGYPSADKPAQPYELISMAPAGSLAASGDDMSKFMIAHLQDGRLGAAEILKPETAKEMHTTALTIIPNLNRMDLGFYEQNINGRRVISHGGDTQFFHSELYLYLDDGVGLFISVNSAGKAGAAGGIRSYLFQAFSDRYLPAPAGAPIYLDAKTAAEHAKMFSGTYANSRASASSFITALGLLGQTKVITNPDGTISVPMMTNQSGVPAHYRETKPFLWQEVGGHSRIGAIAKDGKIVRFSEDSFSPFMVFDSVPASKSSSWLVPAVLLGFLALLITTVAWPARAIIRRRYKGEYLLSGHRSLAHLLVHIMAALAIFVCLCWFWVVSKMSQGIEGLAAIDKSLGLILVFEVLTLIGFGGGFLVACYNLYIVLVKPSSWFAKLWAVVLALSFFVLFWAAAAYKLLSFTTSY